MAPAKIPFNDVSRIYSRHASDIREAVCSVLDSGWWINGRQSETFSHAFAAATGTSVCIPVGNGTDALQIAINILKKSETSEVITVANAGGYTTTAARANHMTCQYADIDPDTLLLSIESSLALVNQNTAAMVATHLYGNVVDIDALRSQMDAAGFGAIPIIEDCSQAHGASCNGKPVGSLGDIGVFSFYPTKNLGAAGDAGALVTSSPDHAEHARQLKQYGWSKKYYVDRDNGQNSRMDEVQAAVLNVLLPHLDALNEERMEIAAYITDRLPSSVVPIRRNDGAVIHLFSVLVEDRNRFCDVMSAAGIATDIHYPVLDCDQSGWKSGNEWPLPVSRSVSNNIVSIPCFAGMAEDEKAALCKAIDSYASA